MTISAKVIADSTYIGGNRITTMVLRYPRFVHAEFMTHRVFSRNAASSRAIPVSKMIQATKDDPAMPVYWGKNQAGMQAAEELDDTPKGLLSVTECESWDDMFANLSDREMAKQVWISARDSAIRHVEMLLKVGLHKQIANRILEPWTHIEVIVTATDWENFYALRNHPMAQPEIQELARKMLEAHNGSIPEILKPGMWHLPYFNNPIEMAQVHPFDWAKVSAARCARVSYLNHDGKVTTYEEDMALYNRLMGGDVKHASPTEHQAKVPTDSELYSLMQGNKASNLRGWIQHRKYVDGETVHVYEQLK